MSTAPVTTAPLLVELFTEELPPKALQRLSEAFAGGIFDGLNAQGLLAADASMEKFSTPRRLAVRVSAVFAAGATRQQSKKLMPVKVGLDADGKATPALLKRLDKEGAGIEYTQRRMEGDAEYVFLEQTLAGVPLAAGLQTALADAIARLPTPKRMSYQLVDGETTVQFVRPAHGLVVLHGDQVVEVSALGLTAGRITHGHRFQGVKDIPLATAITYEGELATHGKVTASFELRRSAITKQLNETAVGLKLSLGLEADVLALLDEVTALVENPAVYAGQFDAEFLSVPQECLILTMRANQKYFPLFDGGGKLANRFLIVSNMRVADPGHIIEGNQRVVRPRLADAQFFFETDKKTKLAERLPLLAKITYQNKLGSQLDRAQRVSKTAGEIAKLLKVDEIPVRRAALLAKADLTTNMVGEFPELQGVMGKYYALHDGEPTLVADAIESHYLPRFAGDSLPENVTGCCVAIADKLDTLVGIYGVGLVPTGDKDPFGLRRAGLGILRILCELRLPLNLNTLTKLSHDNFPSGLLMATHQQGYVSVSNHIAVSNFIEERAKGYLRDFGYSTLEIEAVLSIGAVPAEYVNRLDAVRKFLALPEAAGLAEADKRIRNILNKSGAASFVNEANEDLFEEDAEKLLWLVANSTLQRVDSLLLTGNFSDALMETASIHDSVNNFFDKVMVNAEKKELRENRFAILNRVSTLTNRVANISLLVSEK